MSLYGNGFNNAPMRPQPEWYGLQTPANQGLYQAYLQRNPAAAGPSGYSDPRQQSQGKRPSMFDNAMEAATSYGEGYAENAATDYLTGSGGGSFSPASQAAWNASGLASGGAASAASAASLATVPGVAGGVATIPAGAAIPAGWTAVGSSAAGGTMVAPAASTAMGGTGAAAGSSTMSTLASAAPYLAIALAAYGSYQGYKNAKKNATTGAMTEDEQTAIYSPFRGAAEKYLPKEIVKPLSKVVDNKWLNPHKMITDTIWGSGKDDDQIRRDRVRKRLKDGGAVGEDWNISFSDGSKFDIGKDGGYRDAKGLRQFELDHKNPEQNFQANIIADLNPLGEIIGGGQEKQRDDFTGYFTKAALTGSKDEASARAKARELYTKAGIDQQAALNSINELEKAGRLDPARASVYRGSLARVFGGGSQASAPSSNMRKPEPLPTNATPEQLLAAAAGPMPVAKIQPAQSQRSQTLSPGIGKDGKRINYMIPRKR